VFEWYTGSLEDPFAAEDVGMGHNPIGPLAVQICILHNLLTQGVIVDRHGQVAFFHEEIGAAHLPQYRHERILPSGCAHIVASLPHDFLTNCTEVVEEQRTAPALMVGQRSMHEVIATEDLIDLAGAVFEPGAVTALVVDRADLISNQNLPLDQIWPECTDYLRGRMLEASSPEARLHIFEGCLASHLVTRCDPGAWDPHPAVKFNSPGSGASRYQQR
jgi:hypothetical protein